MMYNYTDLRSRALQGDAKALDQLGRWFEQYGARYWNGESYDADGVRLRPVYREELDDGGEIIGAQVIGWELEH